MQTAFKVGHIMDKKYKIIFISLDMALILLMFALVYLNKINDRNKAIVEANKYEDTDVYNTVHPELSKPVPPVVFSSTNIVSDDLTKLRDILQTIESTYEYIGTDTRECTDEEYNILNSLLSSQYGSVVSALYERTNCCYQVDTTNYIVYLSIYDGALDYAMK